MFRNPPGSRRIVPKAAYDINTGENLVGKAGNRNANGNFGTSLFSVFMKLFIKLKTIRACNVYVEIRSLFYNPAEKYINLVTQSLFKNGTI